MLEPVSPDLLADLTAHFAGRAPVDASPDACVEDFVTHLAEAGVDAHDSRGGGTRHAQAQPVALPEEPFQYGLSSSGEDRVSADVVREWRGDQQGRPGRVGDRVRIAVDARIA